MALDSYAVSLIILASILVGLYILWRLVLLYATKSYKKLVAKNAVSVDDFVGQPNPSPTSCLKVVAINHMNLGTRTASREGLELTASESDKVPGLMITRRKTSASSSPPQDSVVNDTSKPVPIVIGTIRMGFGHHRIAYAASSWALESSKTAKSNRKTYFHDFLNIDSPEANLIHETDQMYSKGSRIASELGGVAEYIWGAITNAGDEDSLRVTYQMAEHMLPLMLGLDKRSVIIASHSLVAAAAVAAGFRNVINLVIDNHAQWFVVVPGALNIVQGPTNYHNLLKMGVDAKFLKLGGHWCPQELVSTIPQACTRRMDRVAKNKPVRLLIPVGGAGAQKRFVMKLVRSLSSFVRDNKVQLFLNAGDHKHMKKAFVETLADCQLEYNVVSDYKGMTSFRDRLLSDPNKTEPEKNVTLFAYDEYFSAVATSDVLMTVADVLVCKPSEMAFYPIPKLMIRRVGDHEMYAALRASELGDGTLECREIDVCMTYVDLFSKGDLLLSMNECIKKNYEAGIYDGCKTAVEIAMEMAEKADKS